MSGAKGRSRIFRIVIGTGIVLLLALAIAQLVLPAIASSRISSRIGRYGKVASVTVKAFPAIELLWGDADSVNVVADELAMTPEQTAALIGEASGTDRLDVRVASFKEGPLRLTSARLQKRGDRLRAAATMSRAAVGEALPAGVGLKLTGSGGGEVHVRVSGGLFGVGASVDAVALAEDGKLVARPAGLLLSAVRLTLFSDPRIDIEGVGATTTATPGTEYRLSIHGRLR